MILFWFASILFLIKLINVSTCGRCTSKKCLVGKTVVITGGRLGIGYETALDLASRGAKIIIASRSCNENDKEKLIKSTNNKNIHVKNLDLLSLESIRNFSSELHKSEEKIDILINNAGSGGFGNTFSDGIQSTLMINYFGPVFLTVLLLDLIKKSEQGRIVFVSSILAFFNMLNPKDISKCYERDEKASLKNDLVAYNNAKVCQIVAGKVLAVKLKEYNIKVYSCHPGLVATTIFTTSLSRYLPNVLMFSINSFLRLFCKNPWEGAQTSLHLALSDEVEDQSGGYFMDCKCLFEPSVCKDDKARDEIWKETIKLMKLNDAEKVLFD